MDQTLDLKITGMHCGACVRRVSVALDALDGVKTESVEVGSARVLFNPAESTARQIQAAVECIGFKVVAASGAGD